MAGFAADAPVLIAARALQGLGAAGVLVGGFTTAALGRSWVFFLTLPISLGGLVAAPRLLDQGLVSPALRGFDAPGAAAVTGAALAVIFGTLSVADHGWSSQRIVVGLLGGAARESTFFLAALYLQQFLAMGLCVAGLAMVPTSVAGFGVSLLVLPRLLRALGRREP